MTESIIMFVRNLFSMFPFTWYRCPRCGYESSKLEVFCKYRKECPFKPESAIMLDRKTASINVISSNAACTVFIVVFLIIILRRGLKAYL